MTIETLGIDIAKNVFQLHGVNGGGRVVFKRRVMRDQLLEVVSRLDCCTIAVEACTGAFYWARKFEGLGHQVRIISPQYVKPFVRLEFLQRVALDTRNDASNEPTGLAHLNHHNERIMLIEKDDRFVQIVWPIFYTSSGHT